MPSERTHEDCAGFGVQIAEHGRRLGDHQKQIDQLNQKQDSIIRLVTEAKDSQDRACQVMATTGTALTSKLEAMSNTQHAMQLDAKELSTTFKLDRENQSTKKTDNRWLIGILIGIPAVINVLITIFR